MAKISFLTLPAEIHFGIAEYCKHDDLINLCLTSKLVNERCLQILYRHVNLQFDPEGPDELTRYEYRGYLDARTRQQQFVVRTLLSHPEYRQHVRFFPRNAMYTHFRLLAYHSWEDDMISEQDLRRAMQSLTRVHLGSRIIFDHGTTELHPHSRP